MVELSQKKGKTIPEGEEQKRMIVRMLDLQLFQELSEIVLLRDQL